MKPFYRFVRALVAGWLRITFRLKYTGGYPEDGAYIVASNHISAIDPLIIAAREKNNMVHFLAKAELFGNRAFARLLKAIGCIPLSRGKGDGHALSSAVKATENGECVGIFPQGTRYKGRDADVSQAKAGVGLLALKTGLPVVPVYLRTKKNRIRIFCRIDILIGKPLLVSCDGTGYDAYRCAAEQIFTEVCALRDGENGTDLAK